MQTKNYKIGDIIGEGATRLKITGFERMNKKTYFRVETLTKDCVKCVRGKNS